MTTRKLLDQNRPSMLDHKSLINEPTVQIGKKFFPIPPRRLPRLKVSPSQTPKTNMSRELSDPLLNSYHSDQRLSLGELEMMLRNFLISLKSENELTRKEVFEARQGMTNLCQEMRNSLAQRAEHPKNSITNYDHQNRYSSAQLSYDSSRPTTPQKEPHIITQLIEPKSFDVVATSLQPQIEDRPRKIKFQRPLSIQGFPAPLKKARPDSERRIIFYRSSSANSQYRPIAAAVDVLYQLNMALQRNNFPSHLRLIKLWYNSNNNLIGLVSGSTTASMLISSCKDLLLRTTLYLDCEFEDVIELERYNQKKFPEKIFGGKANNIEIPLTPSWIPSPGRLDLMLESLEKMTLIHQQSQIQDV